MIFLTSLPKDCLYRFVLRILVAEQAGTESAHLTEMQDNDHALALLAANGDRQAFARLLERHYDFIFRVAWRWTRDRDVAEDVAQSVCMRLGKSIRQWRGKAKFTTWLYRLVINAAQDAQRKLVREERKLAAYRNYAGTGGLKPGSEDGASEALWSAVEELPDQQRNAVLLVHGEGLSHGEAAKILETAESTVSYHIHAARKRLRQMLHSDGKPEHV